MRKLTRKSLSELAMMLPVVEEKVQTSLFGGGSGTLTDPFTLMEWEEMGTSFTKGWVEFSSNILSYQRTDYYSYFGGSAYGDGDSDNDYDEGSTSLYNDTDTSSTSNVSDFPDMDLVAAALLSNQNDFYHQLKNSGQFAAKFVKPGDWKKMGRDDIPPALVVMVGNVKTVYITYYSYQPDAWQYQNLLRQELFHIYQDQMGLQNTGKYTSTIEFQENLMTWIESASSYQYLLRDEYEDFKKWMKSFENGKTVNLTAFLNGVDRWYEIFIDYFKSKNLPKDHPYIQDCNKSLKGHIKSMRWREVLEWYGYTVQ